MHLLRPALLLALVVFLCSRGVDADAYTLPSAPEDAIYKRYFLIYPTVAMCVTNDNAYLDPLSSTLNASASTNPSGSAFAFAGCTPPATAVTRPLYALTATALNNLLLEVRMQTALSGAAAAVVAAATKLKQLLPDEQGPFCLVLDPSSNGDGTTTSPGSSTAPPFVWRYISQMALAANQLRQSAGRPNAVDMIITRTMDLDTRGMAAPSPLSRQSPYAAPVSWLPPFAAIGASTAAPQIANLSASLLLNNLPGFTVLAFMPAQANHSDWVTTVRRGTYNRRKIQARADAKSTTAEASGALYPFYAIESKYPMATQLHPVTYTDVVAARNAAGFGTPFNMPSCLYSSFPSCLPNGGLSVWGTTRPFQPSAVEDPLLAAGVKRSATSRGIALVCTASSNTFLQEDAPAANSAVSGMTAILAVVESLSRSRILQDYLRSPAVWPQSSATAPTNGSNIVEPIQISVFFFTGEEHGLVGSGRFVIEAQTFECVSKPQNADGRQSCIVPFYRTTNFTSVNLSQFAHVIVVDQVGVSTTDATGQSSSSSNVYVHSQGPEVASSDVVGLGNSQEFFNFSSSSAQQSLLNRFTSAGAMPPNRATTKGQLPPNSLYSFYRFFSSKNANLTATNSLRPSSADGSVVHTTLTALTGFASTFAPTYQSTADVTSSVNATTIATASQILLDVVFGLLVDDFIAQDYRGNVAPLPTALLSRPRVNQTYVNTILDCLSSDLACSFVTGAPLFLSALGTNYGPRPVKPSYYPSVFMFYDAMAITQQVASAMLHNALKGDDAKNVSNPFLVAVNGSCPCSNRFYVCDAATSTCVIRRTWYLHAFAPVLRYTVNEAPKYFVQVQDVPGLMDRVKLLKLPTYDAWTESYWNNDLGARLLTVDSDANSYWILGSGLLSTLFGVLVFLCMTRVVGEKLKTA